MRYFEKTVPTLCILTSLAILSPYGIKISLSKVLLIHVISYLSLGIFFELPELSLNSFCLFTARNETAFRTNTSLLTKVLKVRYVLTHFIGPTTGIFVMASGLFLTYRAGYSFKQGWIFWVLISSIIGLYKGMYQHNLYVKYLLKTSAQLEEKSLDQFRQGLLSPFDQCLIFLEFPTYLFSYWAASVKPVWLKNPWEGYIGQWEGCTSIWWTGVAILTIGSLFLIPLYFGRHRFSPSVVIPIKIN